jgi:UDP-N-acetylmuramoylalanine--D-glutamate ligase
MRNSKKTLTSAAVATKPAIPMDVAWPEQEVLVIGMGESGLACCRWLARQGASIRVIDSRAQPPMLQHAQELAQRHPKITITTGVTTPFSPELLASATLLIASPGLTPHADRGSAIAGLLAQAKTSSVMVVSELDLFEWAIHHAAHATSGLTQGDDLELPLELPKVLAITGTNGKTTVTQMTTALLRRAGIDAQEAGNISPSLLDAVMEREDQNRFPSVWVIELSSFQLAMTQHFHPTAAACLNISEDHLDWHLNMADYVSAKGRVFGVGIDSKTTGVQAVVNRQDPLVLEAAAHQAQVTSFGTDLPKVAGDFGLVNEGIQWMAFRDLNDEERVHRLMPADALRVRGRHNAMNALAALALCRSVTPSLAPLLHALREFQGGAHRMEWVANVRGIDFIDDSKGTNVGATIAALQGIGLPVVLIAGGEGKGQQFQPLAHAVAAHARALVTIGEAGPVIAQACEPLGVRTTCASSLQEAVQKAYELAQPGASTSAAVVLMSPACASFDMFANYIARAQAFRAAVAELADAQGVPC